MILTRPDVSPRILEVLLEANPNTKQALIEQGIEKGIEKGSLATARGDLRRVLARRRIMLSSEDEARIDACADLATLERWLDQAITAANASEALR